MEAFMFNLPINPTPWQVDAITVEDVEAIRVNDPNGRQVAIFRAAGGTERRKVLEAELERFVARINKNMPAYEVPPAPLGPTTSDE